MPVRPLNSALAEVARVELGEDPIKLEENIRNLEQWVSEQPHLRARTDDQWLAAFIRSCEHRVEQAKATIDLYYSLRSTAPYLFSVKYFEPKFMDILELGVALILRKTLNPADPRVILYRIAQYDPNDYHVLDIMAVLNLQQQICFMEDDNMVVSGLISIVDLGNTKWSHYTQLSLKQLKCLVQANQVATPIRLKEVHYINTPRYFGTFLNLIKRFLGDRVGIQIIVHNKNSDSLHEHVSNEILPPEYGGNGESVQNIIDYWKEKVREYDSFLEEDLKFGSDESKRPGKSQQS